MRVCPNTVKCPKCGEEIKCGYKEPPIWRNRFHRLYEQYCRIDELEEWEPELAKEISEKKYVYNEGIKYRLNEDDMVLRIDAFLCADPNPSSSSISEPSKEKHKARVIGKQKHQKRLVDLPQK